jgi:hypothetical protein
MQIRRDYSQPFFGNRRRRRGMWRWIILYVILIAGFLFFVDSQFSQLQTMALEMVGQAPPLHRGGRSVPARGRSAAEQRRLSLRVWAHAA